jgi:hypothetical protein
MVGTHDWPLVSLSASLVAAAGMKHQSEDAALRGGGGGARQQVALRIFEIAQ